MFLVFKDYLSGIQYVTGDFVYYFHFERTDCFI